jgi:MFS family permease
VVVKITAGGAVMPKIKTTTIMLGLLCIMYFFAFIDRVNVSIASTAFGPEFGLSNTQIGFILSVFALPYLVFQVVGGWIGDKLGPRRTLTLSVLIMAAATIAIGFVGGIVAMVAARVILGVGEGPTFPVATSAISRWVPIRQRGWAQGITHAFSRLGLAVCPPIIAFLMLEFSWRRSFILVGVATLMWAVLWAWYFRDDPHQHPGITVEELAALPPVESATKRKDIPIGRLAMRMAPVTLVYFTYAWADWLFLGWMPRYFKYNFHLNLAHSALFASIVFLGAVIGDILGGVVTDTLLRRTGNLRVARRNLVVAGLLGAVAALIPMIYVHNLLLSTLFLGTGLFFCEFTIGPMWSVPMDIAPQFSGTATGLMCVGGSFAAFLSPIVTGFLIDLTGSWKMPFLCAMLLLLVGAAFSFMMKPDRVFVPDVESPDMIAYPVPLDTDAPI